MTVFEKEKKIFWHLQVLGRNAGRVAPWGRGARYCDWEKTVGPLDNGGVWGYFHIVAPHALHGHCWVILLDNLHIQDITISCIGSSLSGCGTKELVL